MEVVVDFSFLGNEYLHAAFSNAFIKRKIAHVDLQTGA
jgi:hypothetical protein